MSLGWCNLVVMIWSVTEVDIDGACFKVSNLHKKVDLTPVGVGGHSSFLKFVFPVWQKSIIENSNRVAQKSVDRQT